MSEEERRGANAVERVRRNGEDLVATEVDLVVDAAGLAREVRDALEALSGTDDRSARRALADSRRTCETLNDYHRQGHCPYDVVDHPHTGQLDQTHKVRSCLDLDEMCSPICCMYNIT